MSGNNNPARKRADAIIAAAVIAEEQELADALVEIAEKYGKFNEDDTGIWAGYESAAENERADIGVTCANCILYAGGTTCKIIAAEVEPGGYCRFALIPDGIVSAKVEEKEQSEPVQVSMSAAASRRAPKKDRIYGSKKNKPGSAAGGKKIVFSAKTETALKNKVKEHNEKASAGRRASLSMLKAVYRRGAGAYSSSHRPGKTRDQWAMARVNAFLKLLKSGKPSNPNYKQDNDLLPKSHPRSSKSRTASALTASAIADAELTIELMESDEYQSPEHALVAFAEYSGLGYEAIPALRASWMRAVAAGEDPFERAKNLATSTYSSEDSDLLPRQKALTAAFPDGDWRSAKAKLQRRDRKGRFAEMGGGFSFSVNFGGGKVSRVSGKVVGMSGEEDVDVEVGGHPDLADGTYSVPASKGEAVKAVLSPDAVKGLSRSKVKKADIDDAIEVDKLKKAEEKEPTLAESIVAKAKEMAEGGTDIFDAIQGLVFDAKFDSEEPLDTDALYEEINGLLFSKPSDTIRAKSKESKKAEKEAKKEEKRARDKRDSEALREMLRDPEGASRRYEEEKRKLREEMLDWAEMQRERDRLPSGGVREPKPPSAQEAQDIIDSLLKEMERKRDVDFDPYPDQRLDDWHRPNPIREGSRPDNREAYDSLSPEVKKVFEEALARAAEEAEKEDPRLRPIMSKPDAGGGDAPAAEPRERSFTKSTDADGNPVYTFTNADGKKIEATARKRADGSYGLIYREAQEDGSVLEYDTTPTGANLQPFEASDAAFELAKWLEEGNDGRDFKYKSKAGGGDAGDGGGGDEPPTPSDESGDGGDERKARLEELLENRGFEDDEKEAIREMADKYPDLSPEMLAQTAISSRIGSPEDVTALAKKYGVPERTIEDLQEEFYNTAKAKRRKALRDEDIDDIFTGSPRGWKGYEKDAVKEMAEKHPELSPELLEGIAISTRIGNPEDATALAKQYGMSERAVEDLQSEYGDLRQARLDEFKEKVKQYAEENGLRNMSDAEIDEGLRDEESTDIEREAYKREQTRRDTVNDLDSSLEEISQYREDVSNADKEAGRPSKAEAQFDILASSDPEFASFAEGMMRQGKNKEQVLAAWNARDIDLDAIAAKRFTLPSRWSQPADVSPIEAAIGEAVDRLGRSGGILSPEEFKEYASKLLEQDDGLISETLREASKIAKRYLDLGY